MEPIFENELTKTETGNYELSTSVGEYLANLYFLLSNWVAKKFDRLFPSDVSYAANWICAIRGYFYINSATPPVYRLLNSGGHIKWALDTDFGSTRLKEKIIQNLMGSYFRKDESFEEQSRGF